MPQTYDITQTYQQNYDRGPILDFALPQIPQTPLKDFLGLKVRSRVGIGAGLLLNSKWISAYAKLGFDLVTYKTVRSAHRPCYPLPNWVFVDDPFVVPALAGHAGDPAMQSAEGAKTDQLKPGQQTQAVHLTNFNEADAENASSAVCFGMPSMAPEIWRADIGRAKKSLAEDQALIVSVVATPSESATAAQVAEDFCRCAEWAREAAADIVEANFSCPNVCSAEGTIYLDAKLSGSIAAALRQRLGKTPLLIKTGNFPTEETLDSFLHAVSGLANGVVLVNCIVRPVLHRDGRAVFGEKFRSVGVAGRAIHEPSVAAVRSAVEIVQRDSLPLEVIAVGGVSRVRDIADFFAAGASAVLMGSAPMYLPDLAARAKREHPEW